MMILLKHGLQGEYNSNPFQNANFNKILILNQITYCRSRRTLSAYSPCYRVSDFLIIEDKKFNTPYLGNYSD